MGRVTILIAAVLLGGCAHAPRFVTVPCVSQEQYDQLKGQKPPKIKGKPTGRADQDIKPITGQLIRMEAWGDGLLGVLEGCRG